MDLTPSNLDVLWRTYDFSWQKGLSADLPLFYPRIATERPSGSTTQVYPFMGLVPQLKQWTSERNLINVASYSYEIENKDYELAIAIDRNKIEDDTWAVYGAVIEEMGRSARKWPDIQIATLLQAGKTGVCFDGQYFFDSDHPKDPNAVSVGTQSNIYTSCALSPANYASTRSAMMSLVGENGLPQGIRPDLLVVPPRLEYVARQILNADFIFAQGSGLPTSGGTNVLKGSADLLVVPEIGNEPTTWYLLDTTRVIRPFIWQLRKAPQFVQAISPSDRNVLLNKRFEYFVDARGSAGYGLWQLAARCEA